MDNALTSFILLVVSHQATWRMFLWTVKPFQVALFEPAAYLKREVSFVCHAQCQRTVPKVLYE
jgi:hypothetical protein